LKPLSSPESSLAVWAFRGQRSRGFDQQCRLNLFKSDAYAPKSTTKTAIHIEKSHMESAGCFDADTLSVSVGVDAGIQGEWKALGVKRSGNDAAGNPGPTGLVAIIVGVRMNH
jgi:hypothetical protein